MLVCVLVRGVVDAEPLEHVAVPVLLLGLCGAENPLVTRCLGRENDAVAELLIPKTQAVD